MPKPISGSVEVDVFDLTIDVCVLISASLTKDTTGLKKPCKDLAERIADEYGSYFVALDNRILAQYGARTPAGRYGRNWLIRVLSTAKYKKVTPVRTERATEERLRKNRFGGSSFGEDIKYVEVARATRCRVLVSHDAHFVDHRDLLKAKPIRVEVRSPQEALDLPS